MPPQADISVIVTSVTNQNHAWLQRNSKIYFGRISIVLGGIYQGISWRLNQRKVYFVKWTPITHLFVNSKSFFSLFVSGFFAQIAARCSQKHEAPKTWILERVC